ncbi:hypothetical protein L207DRAFT_570928 [Hyaloscypha variabilis F]|uniref:Uncharacterized protein n=1 Tax=Hyaloscypha variabilis (strain UAMH 11265 / GT02V1 / F) TaxID=1149755 RepID=A0A2J6R726_HYAVF|nr:hypothetical protein L207DRAFT_570928 [Hyaloscypha variabilis F]
MEVQYDSQIVAIGKKAAKLNLNLQEVSDYYHTCHAAAKRSFSHPRVPQIYHQFIAERETWKHYFEDEFPGKDPLYNCFVAALDYIEREPERHINSEGEAGLKSTNHDLMGRIQQLEAAIQRKDLVTQSKDELLKIKEETLLADQALISGKDSIIKMRETELQREIDLVKSHENTIAWQSRDIRELRSKIAQLTKNIQDLDQKFNSKDSPHKLQNICDSRMKEVKKVNVTIRKRENEIRELRERLRMYEGVPGTFVVSPLAKGEAKKRSSKGKREKDLQNKSELMEY